jgi:WD40 repeat protein
MSLRANGKPRKLLKQILIVNVHKQGRITILFTRESHDLFGQEKGSQPLLLAGAGAEYFYNANSPDSNYIAVTRGLDNSRAIYQVDRNGKQTQLSSPGKVATYPTWSPDGRYVAYLVLVGSTWELYLADINTGKNQHVLTNGKKKFYITWER